ncbi:hypothetical protein J6590_041910 [Homalodisca vitripennis]|nr:hypothetical protein J6590_041910 [Homalodisca vitripennis]
MVTYKIKVRIFTTAQPIPWSDRETPYNLLSPDYLNLIGILKERDIPREVLRTTSRDCSVRGVTLVLTGREHEPVFLAGIIMFTAYCNHFHGEIAREIVPPDELFLPPSQSGGVAGQHGGHLAAAAASLGSGLGMMLPFGFGGVIMEGEGWNVEVLVGKRRERGELREHEGKAVDGVVRPQEGGE